MSIISKSDSGYYLQSRTETVMPNGNYKNNSDGLYLNGRLQYKYPINIGEECGEMFLWNRKDIEGRSPLGLLMKNDYEDILTGDSQTTDTVKNCYYYFLYTFFESDTVHVNGYTIFKPEIGMVMMDWVEITENGERRMFNYFASLKEYQLN